MRCRAIRYKTVAWRVLVISIAISTLLCVRQKRSGHHHHDWHDQPVKRMGQFKAPAATSLISSSLLSFSSTVSSLLPTVFVSRVKPSPTSLQPISSSSSTTLRISSARLPSSSSFSLLSLSLNNTRQSLLQASDFIPGTKVHTSGHKNIRVTSVTNSSILSAYSLKPKPFQHVLYLKTHKTGSSTINCILAEYCRTHELSPLLPSTIHINQNPPFEESQLFLHKGRGPYDMVFSHFVYTPEILKYLHNDTFKFTTLREPFSHFISAFNYYKIAGRIRYLANIPGPDELRTFLTNQSKYEAPGFQSWTNNRQSMDLGYDITHTFDDVEYISEFINFIDKSFDLVLINEYFHESLVLLKRKLNWKTEDILFFKKNRGPGRFPLNKSASEEISLRKLHATFSQADILLYNYFLKKFKKKLSVEFGLDEEVSELTSVLSKVHSFCFSVRQPLARLVIPAGQWSQAMSIDNSKCEWLKQGEFDYVRHSRHLIRLTHQLGMDDYNTPFLDDDSNSEVMQFDKTTYEKVEKRVNVL